MIASELSDRFCPNAFQSLHLRVITFVSTFIYSKQYDKILQKNKTTTFDKEQIHQVPLVCHW